MKYASNLPEWQKDVVEFLSGHRKYRIFGWEFGPTLLDYLYRVRENKQPDYTKNGLIVTYSIVPVVALISFASTRRATVTAAATLGVMLFGVLITVAIDYQKTKRKNNGEEEYCLGLLEALGEAPKYWWWTWGKKVKDIEITEKEIERAVDYSSYSLISRLFYSLFTNVALHQLCIARYGYFYNYQELTEEKMPNISVPQPIKDGYEKAKNKYEKVCNAVGDGLSKAAGSLISSTIKNEEVADKLEARSSNLIRKIFNVGDESTVTLKKALESLEIEWLPLHLDKSLEGVRAGTKTIEDHNKYFSEQVREIVKLSLTYHPDKQEQNVNTNAEQGLINNVTKALRNIHDYVIKDKGMLEQRVVYRLFEDAPIKNIIDRDTFVVANIVAKSELSSIAFWEGEILMRGRNEYLRSARNCLEVLSELPKSRNIISSVRRTFDESYDKYENLYQEKWIKNLEELSKECIEVKELEIVKGEVDILLKESKEQCEILRKRSQVEGKADKMFIQPILEYCALMNIYFAFFNVAGEKDMRECSKERDSISEEEKQEIEKLSRQELLKSARDTCSELASKLTKNKKGNQEGRESKIKELGKVLFKLECAIKLLEEEFKVKETLIEREEKRIEVEREERRQKLRELQERIEQDVQARQEAEQRAEQEAQARQEAEQRAEQALVGQAASFMRIAESSSDKNKMIIYQARVRILKDLLMLYRETNSRGSLCLSDDKVYQAREEVYTIHEEMHELVKEIGRDVVLNSITRAEDLVKKSGTIMLNLKKYKLGEEDYKRLEQEVNNLIEQEAQRAEQKAQARQSAEQKAKQLEQALERKNLEKVAIRSCSRKLAKLDNELQDAINEESENKIVEAAVNCARGSPEQVIDAIIEEIKINREQIIKEGRVSVGVIEAGIRSFSNQGTSLSDVNVSHGASAGMGRDSGAGI